MWKDLIKNKYLKNKTLSQVEKKGGVSHFWASFMGVKDQFINLGWFRLNNGTLNQVLGSQVVGTPGI